ncbi:MAG TPA: TonB-dependent receptor plug domain-containing protein, partial [bacterium]|nr:TonB-dependent receptor plug domain-containing protein [bacterium]
MFILLYALLSAEENPYRTVVSEQAEETPATGATTVITEKEIEKKQKGQVADLLRETPGIHVATSGGAGGITSLFIRGGKAGHALVLLDGVRLNDPLSVENAADLSDITADTVSRIEILRGPQAVIYGPDAMSGVVRIVTKRGSGHPALSLTGESGMVDLSTDHIAVNHLRTGASLRGGTEDGDYAAAIYYRDTGGYSAAAERDGNIEEDRSRLLTLNGRAHLFLSDHLTLGASVRAASADTDLDNGPGRYRDDINHTFASDRLLGRVSLDGSFFDGRWLPSWSVAVSHHACDDHNAPDGTGDEWGFNHAGFRGETVEAAWRNDITALPLQRLRAGLVFNAGFGGSDHRTDRERDITALDIERKDTYGLGIYLQDTLTPVEGLDLI